MSHSEGAAPYYEAGAVLGLEIDPAKLYVATQRRCCDCHPSADVGDWQHCPACGKPIWETHIRVISEWDAADPARPKLAGLSVISTAMPDTPGLERTRLGRRAIRAGARLFVGEYVARTDLSGLARRQELPDNLGKLKERLRQRLEPLGLWDESRWGLWAVLNRVG